VGIKEIAEKVWLVTFMHYEFDFSIRPVYAQPVLTT